MLHLIAQLLYFLFGDERKSDITVGLGGMTGAVGSVLSGHPLLIITGTGGGIAWGSVAEFTINAFLGGAIGLAFKIAYDIVGHLVKKRLKITPEKEGSND